MKGLSLIKTANRRRILGFFTALVFLPAPPIATAIIIEPDDYAFGTDLSDISPYVSLRTTGGEAVYASTIDKGSTLAAGGADTGPLGDAVFSMKPDINTEWYYWPALDPDDPFGLSITFSAPVESFSLLFAELFYDAGCCVDDPIRLYLYAPDGTFIDTVDPVLEGLVTEFDYLGADPVLGTDAYPYYRVEYSAHTVGKVIVGGESEPTTIDRLEFTLAASVPEPGTLALSALGLVGVGFARRMRGA